MLASKSHKNGHISKRRFRLVSITKIPTSPTFLMNLSETFRIDVNMDFANNVAGGILILSPKSKDPGFLDFGRKRVCDLEKIKNLAHWGRTKIMGSSLSDIKFSKYLGWSPPPLHN